MADLLTDMALVMQTDHGRRVIQHLIDSSGCRNPTMKADYYEDLLHRGKQSFGLMLQSMASEADFERYIQMIREGRQDERTSGTDE